MKKIFTFIILLSSLSLTAQLADITKDSLVITSEDLSTSFTVKGYIINTSAFDLDVDWEVLNTADIPSQWTGTNSFCFTPLSGDNTGGACVDLFYLDHTSGYNTLNPGDSIELKFAVNANSYPDSVYMKLLIDINESSDHANAYIDTIEMIAEFKGEKPTAIAIKGVSKKNKIDLFPNPVSNKFNILNEEFAELGKLEIYNVIGRKVKTEILNNSQTEISMLGLENGVYIVRVFDNNDMLLHTQSLIKR